MTTQSLIRASLAEERVESGKVAVAAAIGGSVFMAPVAVLLAVTTEDLHRLRLLVSPDAFTPQWEFAHDTLAVMLALFGVVYRYSVRSDGNPMLKQGVIGAFALTRALSAVQTPPECTSLPLSCGAPLGYVDYTMLLQLGGSFLESAVAFGGAAIILEAGFNRGTLRRIPAAGLPKEEEGETEI